jgi:hypothetical protein
MEGGESQPESGSARTSTLFAQRESPTVDADMVTLETFACIFCDGEF